MMREDEIGKVFAAAVPGEVPLMPDLRHRARALGRRKRMHRTVLTAGGAGVAVVAVAGAALAFSGGAVGQGGGAVPAAAGGGSSGAAPGTGANGAPKSAAQSDALAAIKAALPTGDSVRSARSWASPAKFGADLDVAEANGHTFALTVVLGVADEPGAKADCPSSVKCTKGTASVRGQDATWAFSAVHDGRPAAKPTGSGTVVQVAPGADAESLTAVVPAGHYGIAVTVGGKAVPNLPTMADLKNIGLNDKVVQALLAARG